MGIIKSLLWLKTEVGRDQCEENDGVRIWRIQLEGGSNLFEFVTGLAIHFVTGLEVQFGTGLDVQLEIGLEVQCAIGLDVQFGTGLDVQTLAALGAKNTVFRYVSSAISAEHQTHSRGL